MILFDHRWMKCTICGLETSWLGRYEDIYCRVTDFVAPYALCLGLFHEYVDDQCGKPEHRYCWRCHRLISD